jgi:peptidoglycan/xylan/chitin deacetylase (PgdA/CDA1 family)
MTEQAPMRIDRTLTLGLARLRGAMRRSARPGLPILMYHRIGSGHGSEVHPYFRTVTSPARFAEQVALMRRLGYQAITLSQAQTVLEQATADDHFDRKVVITFDDGFRDFLTEAYPVLEQAGFAATVFMPSDFIGRPFLTGHPCLSAAEVGMLANRGIEFGSHSARHQRMVDMPMRDVARELRDSKAAIEDIAGRRVTQFSYPFRFPEEDAGFVAALGHIMDECGYRGGVTTAIGRSSKFDDQRFLPRLPVNGCDDEALLRAKLAGHYDWLRSGQRLRKRSRALLKAGFSA